MVLINSMLNSLPIFMLSYYKARAIIIKKIIKIQRNFLWGGSSNLNHIHWISWKSICLSKENVGLGIKNIASFNKSLMLKWKWTFIMDEDALLKGILQHMYSSYSFSQVLAVLSNDRVRGCKSDSIWWIDIIPLEYNNVNFSYLFVGNILYSLGDGRRLSFWHYKWLANQSLNDAFPNLYLVFPNQKSSVAEQGFWCGSVQNWSVSLPSFHPNSEQLRKLEKLEYFFLLIRGQLQLVWTVLNGPHMLLMVFLLVLIMICYFRSAGFALSKSKLLQL